jgi:hypothetical protein
MGVSIAHRELQNTDKIQSPDRTRTQRGSSPTRNQSTRQADPPSVDAYLGLVAVVEKMLAEVRADEAEIFISPGPIRFDLPPLRTPRRTPL